MAGWFNTESPCRRFRVKEIPKGSALNQGEPPGRCSLAIKGCRTDVSGMEAVVVEIQEGNRHVGSDRIALAQAHPVKHRTGIEHAAKGTEQGEKGLGRETNPVAPGFDRSIVQMADGAINGLADACLLYTSPSPRDLSTSRMPSSA